jgi:hypothetical protein
MRRRPTVSFIFIALFTHSSVHTNAFSTSWHENLPGPLPQVEMLGRRVAEVSLAHPPSF